MTVKKQFSSAGDVDIEVLTLISSAGVYVDLRDYLIEFNMVEDIYSTSLHGSIMLSDSRNLLTSMPILGEENLVVRITTPSMESSIEKMFRIYSVTDRSIVKDINTQVYTLHFCSQEAVVDSLSPISRPFKGNVSDIVAAIYEKYLLLPRSLVVSADGIKEDQYNTDLIMFTETANSVKFISPGWTPMKCINWLCNQAIPKDGKACNFLFWESSKAFYFGSVESLFKKLQKSDATIAGIYTYAPINVQSKDVIGNAELALARKMFNAEDFEVVETGDKIRSYSDGHLGNKMILVDLHSKKIENVVYDHAANFDIYAHVAGKNVQPLFPPAGLKNEDSNTRVFTRNPKLFGSNKNYTDSLKEVYSNRKSNLLDLQNFRINITVPGRTDIEAGAIIYFEYPDVTPKDSTDQAAGGRDKYYSGYYLVSAIRHKINPASHKMIMEIVKDSLESDKSNV